MQYVNVRRLPIFIEASIEQGTQWVAFEPNDEALWARLRRSLTEFLTKVWRDGARLCSPDGKVRRNPSMYHDCPVTTSQHQENCDISHGAGDA